MRNSQSEIEKTPPARLERATHSLEGCCSIRLSYGSANSKNCSTAQRFFVNRTIRLACSLILYSGYLHINTI